MGQAQDGVRVANETCDDDGDEDFIYDVDFARREEREEEEAEKLPSDFVKSPKAARKAGSQRKLKGASAKRRKNSQEGVHSGQPLA
ncbi:hypothetical protein PI125_g6064 [Phytophthora idaei]|nr:hypothetical protein PI125_g6064 [Phytophthora idaei]